MSNVSILIDDVEMTDYIIFAETSFESQLSAVPGTFEIAVRDPERALSFHTGSVVKLDVDGQRYFGGYVFQVTRTLSLPVDDTTVVADVRSRKWILRGSDFNILFDKRFIWNKASGASGIPNLPETTTDEQVVETLCASYLSLEGLGVDYTTNVVSVDDATPSGKEYSISQVGTPWRKEMESLSMLTGAIFYLDGEMNLHYKPYESGTPTWFFSDKPGDNPTLFGFREFEFIEDATLLVNDALVWGGSSFNTEGGTPVFGRTQNTISQSGDADHIDPVTGKKPTAARGRWQLAETHFEETGYFEQEGVERRGRIIVYGSPGAINGPSGEDDHRGLQYPQRNIRLTWFDHQVPTRLYPGQMMTIYLYSFRPAGSIQPLAVTLPLRSIRISFESPTIVRMEGFFGIQTSDPWSLWKYLRAVASKTRVPIAYVAATSTGQGSTTARGTNVSLAPALKIGTTTVYVVPYGYIATTLKLYVNGLRQIRDVNYTENDPEAGEFTLLFTADVDDTLWVEYASAGL